MVKCRRLLVVLTALFFTVPFPADSKAEIRLYRINDKEQEKRIPGMFGNKKPGCHNIMKTVPVHRVIVSRFKRCEVFSEKDCPAEHVLKFRWLGRKLDILGDTQVTTTITPGSKWFIAGDDNQDARSWFCE